MTDKNQHPSRWKPDDENPGHRKEWAQAYTAWVKARNKQHEAYKDTNPGGTGKIVNWGGLKQSASSQFGLRVIACAALAALVIILLVAAL